jgi:hypothetical protein
VALLMATALAPWLQPVVFRPDPGWQTGSTGTITHPIETASGHTKVWRSFAWISEHVAYRHNTDDQPSASMLANLPATAVIVWAEISSPVSPATPQFQDTLSRAIPISSGKATVAGGIYQLTGAGLNHTYSVVLRVYFGSRSTGAVGKEARHAMEQLDLPVGRWPSGEVRIQPGETRVLSRKQLKPGEAVVCTGAGRTLVFRAPNTTGALGGGVAYAPHQKARIYLNLRVNANGTYTVRCGLGGHVEAFSAG